MSKFIVEFIGNTNNETNEIENTCLIAQLMQYITIIGLRENRNQISSNYIEGEQYEQNKKIA